MPKRWTEPELLIAMSLYSRLPFGRFDQRNETIRLVAARMGRTPSSVSMKLCNLASFDPDYCLVVSPCLKAKSASAASRATFADREGQPLTLPHRFRPDPEAMEYHREHVYVA